jgi:formylglycine-generating enzyme required for sulfatase activity
MKKGSAVMIHKSSKQKHLTLAVLFGAAVVLIAISMKWRQFVCAEEPQGSLQNAQRLPDDLVHISNAKYASLDGLATGSREVQERQRKAVEQFGLPLEVKTRKTKIILRIVPPGDFVMGTDLLTSNFDLTRHEVTLSKAFYCGKFEVTQGQWEQVMGSNPSKFKDSGKNAPVEMVSWEDCQVFLKKLCQIEGIPEGAYRLLTEAEWEYACRAGTTGAFYNGDNFISMQETDKVAWCNLKEPGVLSLPNKTVTHSVGLKKPNAFGLYDMHGNVEEWCQDWAGYYPDDVVVDPSGPTSGIGRTLRGGSHMSAPIFCMSFIRGADMPNKRDDCIGLRLARTIPLSPKEN